MLSQRQKFIKKIALPLALVVFLGLFVTDIFFVPPVSSSTIKFFGPKDTSISKDFSPRIDPEAAMVVKEGNRIKPVCFTPLGVQKTLTGRALPGGLWIFLLAAYLFLMFFNLFYDFERTIKIRWFWESLYTLFILWGWYAWDICHQNIWFPLYVIKLGTIVYLAYLYLFYKQRELQPITEEYLENFES